MATAGEAGAQAAAAARVDTGVPAAAGVAAAAAVDGAGITGMDVGMVRPAGGAHRVVRREAIAAGVPAAVRVVAPAAAHIITPRLRWLR
jgi:hypothetical protein